MTGPDLTPYWTDDEWAGFMVQLVPAARLSVPLLELYRQVHARIETDAVLYDLITLAQVPLTDDPGVDDEQIMNDLLASATEQRHFFAPRGVFAVVLVAERAEDIPPVVARLAESPLLPQLRVQYFPLVLEVDSATYGPSPATVLAVMNIARSLIAEYEHRPGIAVDEAEFLALIRRLVDEERAARRAGPAPEIAVAEPSPLSAPSETPASDARPPVSLTAAKPTEAKPLATTPDKAPPERALREPVVQAGAAMVFVQERSPLRRLRTPAPTDADSMEQIADLTDAVALACLVFVPDDENQPREVSKRRRTTALDLDRLLGTVRADADTTRPVKVGIEVLSATSPLRKHGALLPAGELTGGDLPKVPIGMFDLFDTADSLLAAMQRSTRSLATRDVEVLSRHLIFLATAPLRDTNLTGGEWDRLLRQARITWVHFGSAEPRFSELERPSPFGVHILTDADDVPALFRRESKVLYTWPADIPPSLPATDVAQVAAEGVEVAEVPKALDLQEEIAAPKSRHWWPRRNATPQTDDR
ncbi:hypothetical protein [Frankia sp. Cj3]|uniref:hypothetical protein n=1 Tax=Frankia sp. Cj3 TaxID=2880976 RepID=UPI001EF57D8A|nr:hypothetical protein [Frankia sp. Cj3]